MIVSLKLDNKIAARAEMPRKLLRLQVGDAAFRYSLRTEVEADVVRSRLGTVEAPQTPPAPYRDTLASSFRGTFLPIGYAAFRRGTTIETTDKFPALDADEARVRFERIVWGKLHGLSQFFGGCPLIRIIPYFRFPCPRIGYNSVILGRLSFHHGARGNPLRGTRKAVGKFPFGPYTDDPPAVH